MCIKYLYLDDERHNTLLSLAEAVVGKSKEIQIIMKHPTEYSGDFDKLMLELKHFDGLILDWRLDQISNDARDKFQFRAGAIAQELRTRGNEGSAKEIPIVLWSTQVQLTKSYNGDGTSHDLFDLKHFKDTFDVSGTEIQAELLALVDGYKNIKQTRPDLKMMLCINGESFDALDSRLTNRFSGNAGSSVHDFARFILKEMLSRSGVLVDKHILAARLGIDINASKDWVALLESLPTEAKYKGPFHSAQPRWWSHIIDDVWWPSLDESPDDVLPLNSLDAAQRVELIKSRCKLEDLYAAQPIIEGYSTRFGTVDILNNLPLDPIDGVVITDPEGREPFPWQDRRYISLESALNRIYEDDKFEHLGLRLHPTEMTRVRLLREAGQAYAR